MKTKRYFLVYLSLVLLLASSFVSCTQKLPPPAIHEFSAKPAEITSGESTTLLWSVENANTVAIDPGIGNVAKDGTQLVSPHATTAYTLTATNDVATVTEAVVIRVIPAVERGPRPSSGCTCYSYTLKRIIPCEQATAICRDGTCSISKSRRGTCSHHGGVARWLD